jgi:hypothetical protein
MPKDRKSPTRASLVEKAMQAGAKQAAKTHRRRASALRTREEAVKNLPVQKKMTKGLDAKFIVKAGPADRAGVLIAEGDSWFDYPGADVLSLLEDEHGYDVESVAHAGDRVENMAYMDGQLDDFSRAIEKIIRSGTIPRAILLSGGGNDLAGAQFEMLVDHIKSPIPGLNTKVVDGVINQRCYYAYIAIINAVSKLCETKLGRTIPILVHGYDYPVPDGRGFGWSWVPGLPGPWLQPGFSAKGFEVRSQRVQMAMELIDTFNKMVSSLPNVTGFGHVKYVNLRGTLSDAPSNYKDWWANELHPTPQGFSAVAEKFAAAIP